MPTTWNIGVDWNRDGFLCRDARPGDALNLLPSPLTHATLSSAGFSGATCTKRREDTRYGRLIIRSQSGELIREVVLCRMSGQQRALL